MRAELLLAGMGLFLAASVWSAGGDVGSPIAAVWREQRLNFSYMGRTSRYSCEGLRDKVRSLLLDLGVRRDLRIAAIGCEDAAALAQHSAMGPSLDIAFSAPEPAHLKDSAAIDARFTSFTITNDVFRNMGAADCELVEEFTRQILPKLAVRNLKQDITCVPSQQSGARYLVRGEVLKVLPR